MPTHPIRNSSVVAVAALFASLSVVVAQAEAKPNGTPGPTDNVVCNAKGWVFGVKAVKASDPTNGDFMAYPVTNILGTKASPPVISGGVAINPPQSKLNGHIVRGSAGGRFYTWDAQDKLFTFSWSGTVGTQFSAMTEITPPSPFDFNANRQLRTVDEAGNIFYFTKDANLMRATVTIDAAGNGKFTHTGEIVVPKSKIGSMPRALWASGDGVIHFIAGDQSFALQTDVNSHRVISAVKKTADERKNEDYVASIGGSVDFALSRSAKKIYRYRYDPTAIDPKNFWPSDVPELDKAEFANLATITGWLDGCSRKDPKVAALEKPVPWDAVAQTTFAQANTGSDVIAGFKYQGNAVGWASTTVSGGGASTKLSHYPVPATLQIRPPMAIVPEGDAARLFAITQTVAVTTGIATSKSTGIATTSTNMGGMFPSPVSATRHDDGPAMVLGVSESGDVWYSEHNGTTFTAWTKVPDLWMQPGTKITLDSTGEKTARFFAIAENKRVTTGILNQGGTVSNALELPALPNGEVPRPGVGTTFAKTTHSIVVASTTGAIYTLRETDQGWDPAWAPAAPAGFTPGVPGIVDDTYNNRTYVFARGNDNAMMMIKDNPAVPGTYGTPEPVQKMQGQSLVDDPITRPMLIQGVPSFGTVVRNKLGETWLLFAQFGTGTAKTTGSGLAFHTPVKVSAAQPPQ